MKTERRAGLARCDAAGMYEDPKTGFLHIPKIYTAKPGVLTYYYKRIDGSVYSVKELVTKEVLHDAAMRATLENKAIIDEHRFDASGKGVMITDANAKTELSGWTTGTHDIAVDGEHTVISGVIVDPKLKSLIKSNKHQVSPGYDVKIINQSGEHPEYGHYDAVQVFRDYNHLAVTWRARGGATIAIRTDSDNEEFHVDAWEISEEENQQFRENNMIKIRIDGHEVEVSEAAKVAYEAQQVRVDSEMKALNDKIKDLESEKDIVQGRVDALGIELKAAKDNNEQFNIDAAVNARLALIEKARPHLPESQKFDGMSDDEIKCAVLAAKYDSLNIDGVSSERIDGMFEVAVMQVKEITKTDAMDKAQAIYAGAERKDLDPIAQAYQNSLKAMTGDKN